eukprot:jgi/Botrbrau1/20126/Bobra.0173s0028.1
MARRDTRREEEARWRAAAIRQAALEAGQKSCRQSGTAAVNEAGEQRNDSYWMLFVHAPAGEGRLWPAQAGQPGCAGAAWGSAYKASAQQSWPSAPRTNLRQTDSRTAQPGALAARDPPSEAGSALGDDEALCSFMSHQLGRRRICRLPFLRGSSWVPLAVILKPMYRAFSSSNIRLSFGMQAPRSIG